MLKRIFGFTLGLLSLITIFPAAAIEVHVAVAANFTSTLTQLSEKFNQLTGNHLIISSGSSGKLYAQIKNGAPFDVFLSADIEHPQRLEQEHVTVPGSRFVYARGQLVLWGPKYQIKDGGDFLRKAQFKHLALANPAIAPYGLAAMQTLTTLGLQDKLHSLLVRGEDIGQTFQFVSTGNADAGFVALAQLRALSGSTIGGYWMVPQAMYAPIEQQAVLLKHGAENSAARAFLDFLKGPQARAMITRAGYAI